MSAAYYDAWERFFTTTGQDRHQAILDITQNSITIHPRRQLLDNGRKPR